MKRLRLSLGLMFFVATAEAQEAPIGGAYDCGAMPAFVNSLDLKQPMVIDTTIVRLPGVVIRELQGERKIYQKRGWNVTGHVGSTVRDSQGAIFAAPSPSIALDTNPLSKRNTIYRINPQSGKMETFIELPLPSIESQENPFGVTGLAIDCDTKMLYASSLAGSTPSENAGVIYQIDLKTGKIVDSVQGIDALGIAVFNAKNGKQLYYGDARSSSLMSLALQKDGRFFRAQSPQYILSLLAIRNGDSTQIRKIRFINNQEQGLLMNLDETEFSYRIAAAAGRRYRKYTFSYNFDDEKWALLSIRH